MIPNAVIEEKKYGQRARLETVFANAESKGMPILHDGNTYHLQCRPTDRVNWLGVITMANMLPSDSDTVTIMTKQNEPITLTKPQVIKAMVDVGLYSQALYGARWATKNAIENNPNTDVETTFQQALQAILS